jgi:multimeric flavodoxin WrbA
MKVLLIRANPRKTGYTERLANLFLKGLRDGQADLTDVDLTALSIAQCTGCQHCWLATPGQCVHGDDMAPLLEKVVATDVMVCVTPVYFFSMSAPLKTFLERLFPLSRPGLFPSGLGLTRNGIRYPENWHGKKLITLAAGALPGKEPYRPLNETFRLIADSLDMELGGQLTRPETSLLDYPLSKPMTLKRIESAFIEAGRQAASTGRLTEDVMDAAATPLSASPEAFRLYSNIYWETAQALGADGLDLPRVQRIVGTDVRILLREMVRCIDPGAAKNVRALLEFEFPDRAQVFGVRIDRGTCALHEGTSQAPDLRIRCDSNTWAGLFTRQIDVRQALATKELVLEGDKSLFSRLDRLFPPPAT